MTKKLEALKKCGNDIVDRLEFFGNRNPKCPYCGEEWWELYEEGDHTVTCPSCDHDFIVRTSVSYSFSTDEQHDGEAVSERQAENMRRLAAAWNACEGLSTRTIEILAQLGGVTSKMPAVAKLAADRDELLEALRHIEGASMDISCDRRAIRNCASAAIAKVEAA